MDHEQAVRFGEYLRNKREERGVSIRSLARQIDINMTQIVRLEQGAIAHPKVEMLDRIASLLGIPATDLFRQAGYPVANQLPGFKPYLRAKYDDLPEEAVQEMEKFFTRLAKKHGIDGPIDGEDER